MATLDAFSVIFTLKSKSFSIHLAFTDRNAQL